MSRALDRISDGLPIVADGGVGALVAAGAPRLRCPEEANLRDPEAVLNVHLDFVRAGAELISANTFGANRHKLAGALLDERLEEIVGAGVKLAREAREVSGRQLLVGGSLGPAGDAEDPLSSEERFELFSEQARLLEGRGVDLFLVETFFDLDELVLAIDAVRDASALPIVAQLTFDEDGETLAGVTPLQALDRLEGRDVQALGANCGLGPQAALQAIAELAPRARGLGLPLAAQPNVGLPSRAAGRLLYPNATAAYFSEFAAQARSLGARVIGGCCGTTPTQIAAIRAAIDEERTPRVPLVAAVHEPAAPAAPGAERTRLAAMLEAGEWVVSVELDPPKGTNLDRVLEAAHVLRDSGLVSVLDVNDNPMARARMSSLVAAAAIERAVGIETIPHVTPRDSTIMGLESQLLGAHAEGVRNLLVVTGDPPNVGDYPGSHGVYEVDAIGLASVVQHLNHGSDHAGKAIDAPTSFFVGVAVNPSAEALKAEIDRFRRKVAAGASFAMTQALFDLSSLDRFLDALGGESPVPLLVGIWPLRSFRLAFRLHNEVPGIVVPEAIQERLAAAGPDAARVGLELARGLYEAVRDRAAGVYVIPPFKEPEAALELLT